MKTNKIMLSILSILICTVSMAYYWCMVDCPYRGDDWLNINSGVGTFYYTGESTLELTIRIAKSWINTGRFFPLSNYVYYLFNIFSTLHSYRIFLFCITLIMVLLSARVIDRIVKNSQMTAAFLSLLPIMFYLSEYYSCNPLLCYHGLMQMTVILFMISMLFLLKWIDSKKISYAILAGIFYFMSLCTYEVSYVFIVFAAFAILYRESDVKRAIKKLSPI